MPGPSAPEAAVAPPSPEAKGAASPERQRAAFRAVDAALKDKYKTTRLDEKGEKKSAATNADNALDTYFLLTRESPQIGFDEGNPIKLSGLKTPNNPEGKDLTLAEVRGATEDGKYLLCYAKDASGKFLLREGGTNPDNFKDRQVLELPRDSVIILQLQSQPDEYAGLFAGDQKALTEAVIRGDGSLPDTADATIDAIEAETGMPVWDADAEKPDVVSDKALELPLQHLQTQLDKFTQDDLRDTKSKEQYVEIKGAIAQLEIAQAIGGDIAAVQARLAALQNTRTVVAKYGGDALIVPGMNGAIRDMEADAIAENEAWIKYFREHPVPEGKEKQHALLMDLVKDPSLFSDAKKLGGVLKFASELGFQDLMVNVFGNKVNEAQAQSLLNTWVDNCPDLSPAQRERLRNLDKGTLLAIFVAIAAGAGGLIIASIGGIEGLTKLAK